MSDLRPSELPAAEQREIAELKFAAAMLHFRKVCTAQSLSDLDKGIDAQLKRGDLEK